jgi:hypothetical protein
MTQDKSREAFEAWWATTPSKYHDGIQQYTAWEAWQAALEAQQEDGVDEEVMAKMQRAIAKFPTWPTDPLHALAILGEEFGELTKATLQTVYEPHKSTKDDVREEAVQTAAMALRFLASLDVYEYTKGAQHKQQEILPYLRPPHTAPAVSADMPYQWDIIEQWCGGLDNIKEGKTYNVTGTHLRQILSSYCVLEERCTTPAYAWRPIESAPRDGTKILVSCLHGQYVVACLKEYKNNPSLDCWYVDDNKHSPLLLRGAAPTHWAPLRSPPVTLNQKDGK